MIWTSCPDEAGKQIADHRPHILGINPWIYDFAAFNLWSRPAGLLTCLQLFRQAGARTALLDCLDPMWSDTAWPRSQRCHTGSYPKVKVEKPGCLQSIPRQYSRYGLPYNAVSTALSGLKPPPDLVLITSIMTYWYPGVLAAIDLVRSTYPRVPIVLGGIYATLCFEHARQNSGADLIVQGPVEDEANWSRIWGLLQDTPPDISGKPSAGPALDLYPEPDYSIILGSRGCPFHCAYCASDLLNPGFSQRGFEEVRDGLFPEIGRGIRDFAFYDDALLVKPETWLRPLLEELNAVGLPVRLHTPNALHVRFLTPKICKLLHQGGLTTIRLGLETADFSERTDEKLSSREWDQGIRNLLAVGFRPEQIGAYILFGLPGQDQREVVQAISFAKRYRIRPHLAHYSPIPGSRLFAEAKRNSPYPLEEEPLFQNNSIWPCYKGGFTWQERTYWKKIVGAG
ncbi:MAG: B12-binding domain-containing radical SAM protein [Desulfohalobiaceae bacterium]|nr:B12-binding domain-containing radical SAM protein [Desulfohalobiaceae bacterium]